MRVLQVGYGAIGREVFRDYASRLDLARHHFMVTDLRAPVPSGYEWDGDPVDLAVILVNTPRAAGGGFDHSDLLQALREYGGVAEFLLVRSTVTPSFLDTRVYSANRERIGFAPEFYGATKWSRRAVLDMGFSIFTENVPAWFVNAVRDGDVISGKPIEVILAKLAENAYLATKVTFFHELHIAAEAYGADPETVRRIVGLDPRIGHGHTVMEEPGWTSHCFDKDVPEYADYADSDLVRAAILVNRANLLPRRSQPNPE
jgi:UDP-glucose 6-dehydrogenase